MNTKNIQIVRANCATTGYYACRDCQNIPEVIGMDETPSKERVTKNIGTILEIAKERKCDAIRVDLSVDALQIILDSLKGETGANDD